MTKGILFRCLLSYLYFFIMKLILLSLLLGIAGISYTQAQIPAGYYDNASGKEGEDLREALKNIISSGHTANDYGDLYGYYQSTDNYVHDGYDAVWDMYSMHDDGTANYWFAHKDKSFSETNKTDCSRCTEGLGFNREHSVPQSWFSSYQPMEADLFIVYPTDECVNSMRGHHPFGETDNPDWVSTNGSKRGPCSFPEYVADPNIGNIENEGDIIFEPIDRFKGDFARTYFYTVTRYKDKISSWTENVAPDVFKYDNLEPWAIALFLKWHREDPVSQKEIDRNNAVYDIQHNRNPFIDHPEWVECIWDNTCKPLSFTSYPEYTAMATVEYVYNISYNVDIDAETLTCTLKPAWLSFSKDESTNTAVLSGTPSVSDIGEHDVELVLSENGETSTQNFTITVSEYSNTQTILDVDFSNCPAADWTTYSVASNKNWICNSGTYEINAYGGDEASDDWFISPAINFDTYENEILTFKTWTRYTDTEAPRLKLKYSANYSGSGDPTGTTWTEINYTPSAEDSQQWTESGSLDLSQLSGTGIYLAFHYTSSGTGGGSSTYWILDDILLQGDLPQSVTNAKSELRLYPNPANNILNIEFNGIGNLSIYNIQGQKLYQNKLSHQLDISDFPKGIYFLKIKSDKNEILTGKFIKQ